MRRSWSRVRRRREKPYIWRQQPDIGTPFPEGDLNGLCDYILAFYFLLYFFLIYHGLSHIFCHLLRPRLCLFLGQGG